MADDAKSVSITYSPTILERLNAVMSEVSYLQKEKKAGMRYSIVSHDAVTAKVRPLMVKHGVVYWPSNIELTQVGNRTQVTMQVTFASTDSERNEHGQYDDAIVVHTAGFGIDDQDKGPGKAISYAMKYALLKALGMESGDDPDEDQDAEHKPAANDPVRLSISDFERETKEATDMEALRAVAAKYKEDMEHALDAYPAFVQKAKAAWQKQAAILKAREVIAADAATFPPDRQ
jgi:hypothetical protein